jgi:hypothetical protein
MHDVGSMRKFAAADFGQLVRKARARDSRKGSRANSAKAIRPPESHYSNAYSSLDVGYVAK